MKTRRCGNLLVGGLLVLAAGCIPEFTNPLPPPDKLEPDRDLLGGWTQTEKSGTENQVLFYSRPTGWIDVLYLMDVNSGSKDSGLDWAVYEGYSSALKGEKFLSLRAREKDYADRRDRPEAFTYMLALYRVVSNDYLEITLFSEQKVRELVEAGALAGGVGTNRNADTVKVTASSDALKKAVEERPLGDFVDPSDVMKFERLTKATR